MEDDTTAIAALERVVLTVEAELMALHSGEPLNAQALEARLGTDVTTPARAMAASRAYRTNCERDANKGVRIRDCMA